MIAFSVPTELSCKMMKSFKTSLVFNKLSIKLCIYTLKETVMLLFVEIYNLSKHISCFNHFCDHKFFILFEQECHSNNCKSN